jgi:WD repeat-containing protein 76
MARTKNEKPEMSAFERKRLENIAANQAILKDLSTAAEKIIPKPAPKPAAPRAPRKKVVVQKEPIRPSRTSSRIAGIEADSEIAKRKAEDEYELAKETARTKRQRVTGDLDLSRIVVEGKQWNKSDNFLSSVMRGAQPYERTFTEDDIKKTTDKGLKALREKMSGLELYETYTPNRKLSQWLQGSLH